MVYFSCCLFCSGATIVVPYDYSTIQQAIDAAIAGDTIQVAQGTYIETIDFKGKGINVISKSGPAMTVIDGGQAGSVATFMSGESFESVLSGFTVTNGIGAYTEISPAVWGYCGGGVFCQGTSPTLRNNIIRNNVSDYGGSGIYCSMASPKIVNNTICYNETVSWLGGGSGIYCNSSSSPEVIGNEISNNVAEGVGGGIFLRAWFLA